MPSIESGTVPDTVQLMVEVAGLYARAPALEIIRPAGIAPWWRAQTKRFCHLSRCASSSTSDNALATLV